jgi:hypothetical protein
MEHKLYLLHQREICLDHRQFHCSVPYHHYYLRVADQNQDYVDNLPTACSPKELPGAVSPKDLSVPPRDLPIAC